MSHSGMYSLNRQCATLLSLLLVIAFIAPLAANADEALDNYNLATGLYKQKRWEQSAGSFRSFIKDYPKHVKLPLARLYLGLTLVHLKKYDDSRIVLRAFVKDYPRSKHRPDAMYRVAECSYFLGDMKSAAAEFNLFLKSYPKNDLAEWALPYLADAQRRQNELQAAVKTYQLTLKTFPQSRFTEESTFGLARCYESLKQPGEAIATYRNVVAMKNGTRAAEAQMAIATIQFDTGSFRASAASYEQFIESFPKNGMISQAELNAGFAYYQASDFAKAVERFSEAAKDNKQKLTASYWRGISRKALGRYADAARDLETAFKGNESGPLAAKALFQWADTELHQERFEPARTLFLDLVKRWPKDDLADDSLHLAAEAALSADQLDSAEQLIARFTKEYSGSSLRMYNRILAGRLAVARGGDNALRAATEHFRAVVNESNVPRTRSLARFHLARTLQQLNDDEGVIETVAPLTAEITKTGVDSEFVDVLIIAGNSQLALKKYGDASVSTSLYLKLRPQGSQREQAYATRAMASAWLGKKAESQADLKRLGDIAADGELTQQSIYKIAEIAYDQKDWEWSAGLYTELVARGPKSANHAHALSGLAWCRFEQKQYLKAADHFGQLVKLHPDEEILAPESSFKRAESLENADRLPEAAAAYGESFDRLAPKQPAAAKAELRPPLQYAYLSGLNRARILRALKNVKEADAAYDSLLQKFPKPAALDKRLDEWALLNYDAGEFKRSDEIFARLVKETPDSDLADNARLSLAESDLLAGNADRARQEFDRLQRDAKSDKQVQEVSLHHLVGLAVEQERWKDIGPRAAELLKRFPESKHAGHARFQSANAALNLNKNDLAQQELLRLKTEFAKPAKVEPLWVPQIWIMLAETYFRQKKYGKVESVVAELRARDAKCPVLYQADEVLGRSYKNLAKFDESRIAFRRVISDPNGRRTETAAKSQFLLAETYLIQKDYKNAQTEHFKVYHLYKYPEWQTASLYQAALCDEALKRWGDATKLYEELIEKFPGNRFAAKAKERLPLARKNAGS